MCTYPNISIGENKACIFIYIYKKTVIRNVVNSLKRMTEKVHSKESSDEPHLTFLAHVVPA